MDQNAEPGARALTRFGRWLSAGTGQLAVLTALGGLLVTLAYAIDGWQLNTSSVSVVGQNFSWLRPASWVMSMLQSGNLVLDILGLAVALYTAYGIAGRPTLAPAFAGGLTAVTLNTGWLGGLTAGVLAGVVTRGLRKVTVPDRWRPLMVNAVIPLLTTIVTAIVFFSAIVAPQIARFDSWLYGKLVTLELSGHHLALGVVLGLIACFDFDGILYKTAYGFGLGGIQSYQPTPDHLTFMAVVAAVGMAPSVGLSLATLVRGRLFTEAERHYGKVAWLLGLGGVTAGPVPFALRDPLRVIPACLAGGAVTGVLTMTFGAGMGVPHGGLFAAGRIDKPLLLVAAVAAGGLVTAAVTVGLKSMRREPAPAPARTAKGARTRVAAAR